MIERRCRDRFEARSHRSTGRTLSTDQASRIVSRVAVKFWRENKTIKVYVRPPTGDLFEVVIGETDEIYDLQEKIEEKTQIEIYDQELYYQGRQLGMSESIRESGLTDGCHVSMIPPQPQPTAYCFFTQIVKPEEEEPDEVHETHFVGAITASRGAIVARERTQQRMQTLKLDEDREYDVPPFVIQLRYQQ